MASPFSSQVLAHLEHDALDVNGYVALDGAANVIGFAPTTPGGFVATSNYTRCKGMQRNIGPAGAIILQPHTATGTYIFTLDEPWIALLGGSAQLIDQGAIAPLTEYVDANVTNQSAGIGYRPGNNSALAPMTFRVRFRNPSGTLTDPVASTGFFLQLTLMRSGID